MADKVVVTGTLSGGRTVTLDECMPVLRGRVRVTVEVLESIPPGDGRSLAEVMEEIWEAQRRRGHVPRSREEIDAEIAEGRGH